MKIEYSPEHDVLNIEFLEDVEIENSIGEEGIIFDYSKDRKIVSVEILDAKKRIGKNIIDKVDFSIISKNVVTL